MSFKHASIDAETNSLSCAGDIWVTLSESLRRSKIYLTSQSVASMWIPKVVSYISISVNFLDIKVNFTALTIVAFLSLDLLIIFSIHPSIDSLAKMQRLIINLSLCYIL